MFSDPPNLILIACKNLPKQSSDTQQLATGHRVLYVKWQASRPRLPRTTIAPCKSVITASGRYKNLEMLVAGHMKRSLAEFQMAYGLASDFTRGSAICLRFLPVEIDFPIDHVRHVAALAQELHHLLARPCHLRPTGFRFWVLLQPTNLTPVENEVHLP